MNRRTKSSSTGREPTRKRPLGFWRGTAAHLKGKRAKGGGREVGSLYAELPDAVVLVDPFVPANDAEEQFWPALDRDVERLGRPVYVLLTVHWHERSVE